MIVFIIINIIIIIIIMIVFICSIIIIIIQSEQTTFPIINSEPIKGTAPTLLAEEFVFYFLLLLMFADWLFMLAVLVLQASFVTVGQRLQQVFSSLVLMVTGVITPVITGLFSRLTCHLNQNIRLF